MDCAISSFELPTMPLFTSLSITRLRIHPLSHNDSGNFLHFDLFFSLYENLYASSHPAAIFWPGSLSLSHYML